MHVLGNDTIVINCMNKQIKNPPELARRLCMRNFGIGADSMVLVLPSKKADFKMRLFNPDGSEAEFGGNELLVFAKYVYDSKLIKNKKMLIETLAGVKQAEILDGHVRITVGKPSFNKKDIPMKGTGNAVNVPIKIGKETLKITALSVGNPHAVVFVDTFNFPLETKGRLIENHGIFPNKVNVQFVEVINKKEIAAQQWERGAGVTLATGTGAAAALAACVVNKKCGNEVVVHFIGGDMKAEWKNELLYVTGKPVLVCQGKFNEKM